MSHSTTVAVIGAGHAGIEAALAAARLGVDTVLFTMSRESIANMPCNPSIGGTPRGIWSMRSTLWAARWVAPPTP